ncbi:MAG: hypothetical protein QM749_04155 [Aquabacterium sp.]
MDTKDCTKQAASRVDAQDLAQAVARAVARAQAVRHNLTELNAEQTRQVSGGLTTVVLKPVAVPIVKPPIIYGGIPVLPLVLF